LYISTEDKPYWCKKGEKLEKEFVRFCKEYKLKVQPEINPEKIYNKYAPDLIIEKDGVIADLKVQTTPFFMAYDKFGIDPTYAVTFNEKDYKRYSEKYPEIDIFFWINWTEREKNFRNKIYTVEKLNLICTTSFQYVKRLIDKNKFLHFYKNRKNDTQGNAKSSFLIDVREIHGVMYKE
jgi:hypothetical protein